MRIVNTCTYLTCTYMYRVYVVYTQVEGGVTVYPGSHSTVTVTRSPMFEPTTNKHSLH